MRSDLRMKVGGAIAAIMLLPFTGTPADDEAQTQTPQNPSMLSGANYASTHDPAILMRSQHFDYDHEVRVSLPPAYAVQPEKSYPVLWLTDGSLAHDLTVGIADTLTLGNLAPELIVVSVGAPNNTGMMGYARRSVEFAAEGERYLFDGPGADWMYANARAAGMDLDATPSKADDFLSFIIDEVRPALAKKYRFSGDHGLAGHSGGGAFTAWPLFARPLEFNKYIIGSPALHASDRLVMKMEEEYAKDHKDFPVSVYLAVGGAEINNMAMAAWEIVSAPVLLAERLRIRQYPSLQLKGKVYEGRNHLDVLPLIIMDGIQVVWGGGLKFRAEKALWSRMTENLFPYASKFGKNCPHA